MPLLFDRNTLAPAACHFIGGTTVGGAPGMAIHRPSDGGYKASGLGKDLGRIAYRVNRRSKSVLIDIQGEAA